MKIRASHLRKLIEETVAECYGWPTEKEEHLYGKDDKLDVENPRDPVNKSLKFPKGPNSRTNMGEGFVRPTSEEIMAWRNGDFSSAVPEDTRSRRSSSSLSEQADHLAERLGKAVRLMKTDDASGEAMLEALDEIKNVRVQLKKIAEQ
jgi:hypothetical protein